MTLPSTIVIFLFLIRLFGTFGAFAQTAQTASNFSNGSGTTTSTSFKLKATIGQSLSGNSFSTSYSLFSGFEPGSSAVVPKFPELEITVSGILPLTVAPGQATAVTLTVKNKGDDVVTGNIIVKSFLSVNTSLDAGDIALESFTLGSSLAVNAQIAYPGIGQPNSITIPAGTAIGSYQIILKVDPDDAIAEKNETNNTSSLPISVSTSGPGIDTEPPLISQFSGGTFTTGSPASAQVTDASGVKQVQVFYRPITANDFLPPVLMTLSNDSYTTTLQADWADDLGMEAYLIAEDNAGNKTSAPLHVYWYKTVEAANSVIPFASGFGGSAATYEMFSVPYVLTEKIASTVFDELGGADKTIWRLFHWQGDRYLEFPDNLTNIDIGKGYWFNTKQKTEFNAGGGKVAEANQSQPFKISLDKGWNQIGNPYPFNISWDAVQAANIDAGLNSLWLFEGVYKKKDVLAKWKGAFVFCDNGGEVSFPVLAKTSSPGRVNENMLSPTIDESAWHLPITLTLNGLEQISGIGMDPDARPSKDKFDEITVPRFIDYLEMSTYHEEFFAPYFSTDMVPSGTDKSWLFTVSSNQKDGQAMLSWDQASLANAISALALIDLKEGVVVDMKKNNQYAFSWSEGRQFKVLFSRDGELHPGVTLLGTAFPNPFNERVTVPVLLEQYQHLIQIDVYDLMGRKVKTFSKESAQAGVHEVVWDGRNDQGSSVEAGLYLYQLRGDKGIMSTPKRMIKQ